jgi:hypothetical protein
MFGLALGFIKMVISGVIDTSRTKGCTDVKIDAPIKGKDSAKAMTIVLAIQE